MLKVAVVGTGLIATQKHLPAWQKMSPVAKVVALCDVNRARGSEIAARFGVQQVYTDVDEMLSSERPDIVDICTPPRSHAAIAIQSMEAGAHVLVEKPMAVGLDDCDRMIDVSSATGKSICVAHSDLFYPSFLKLRRLVESGGIGDFRGMAIRLSTPVDYITSRPDHWANALPGGVIGETGPHVVYMTLAFINPIIGVHTQARKLLSQFPWSPYEDYRVILDGESATSSVTLTYATDEWAARVDVWGDSGQASADLESQAFTHTSRKSLSPATVGRSALFESVQITEQMLDAGIRRIAGRLETTHERLIRAFCRSILDGTEPPVTAQEGRESIRIMDEVTKQLEQTAPCAASAG